MSRMVTIFVNDRRVETQPGASLGAVLHTHGPAVRTSLSGERRGLYCGMGVCFECQVRVDGRPMRACLATVVEGMRVETDVPAS